MKRKTEKLLGCVIVGVFAISVFLLTAMSVGFGRALLMCAGSVAVTLLLYYGLTLIAGRPR